MIALERSWPALARTLRVPFARWRSQQAALQPFAHAEHLLAFLGRNHAARCDPPLLALLELAATDAAAAQLCLQAILPALKAQAGRFIRAGNDRDEVWEIVLASAWEAIRTYPLSRRRQVAANLVLQVLHVSSRTLRHARSQLEPLPDLDRPERPTDPRDRLSSLGADGLVAAAVRAGIVSRSEADLVLRSRVDGAPLRELAVGECGYEALRKRRQRAERSLRCWIEQLPDACPEIGPSGPYLS